MNVNAIKHADRRTLVELAAKSAENACGLLADAELLLESGRWARAYSLALLSSEEYAKAYSVVTLSFMSPELRSQIPGKTVRHLLESHVLKATGAELVRAVEAARPGVAARVAGMPDLAGLLTAATQNAAAANTAKERGLYADLLADGRISLPSDITEGEAAEAVARAREVRAQMALLRDGDALAGFADPPPQALAAADALFGRWLDVSVDDAEEAAVFIAEIAAGLLAAGGSEAEEG